MRLNDTLKGHERAAKIFQELVEVGAIRLGPKGFMLSLPKMSTLAYKTITRIDDNPADVIEAYSFGKLLAEGIKIFRPQQEQLEMLEQMQLNIPLSDYVQPYSTLVVEFPDLYIRNKTIHCPQGGHWYYGKQVKSKHEPGYAIIRHEPGYIFVTLVFNSELSIKTSIRDEHQDLETSIEAFTKSDEFFNSMEVTPEEWEVTKSCVRSALNYCLLLDEIGHKQERGLPGLPNPRQIAGSSTPATYYELSQSVTLHRSVAHHKDLPGEATGRTMPPHHRRGHYRMQRHGEGLCERKRIRIAPVFVNSHLFLGKMSDAKATYT